MPASRRTPAEPTPLTGSWAFVDLETTGGNPARNRIIEVAVVAVDDGIVVDEWARLVAPGRPIPPSITGLTGIDDAMLADAPAFSGIRDELLERLRGRTVVAHNARFDYGFLRHEFRREGITFRAPVMCTVRLSRALYPGVRGHGLDALIRRFDLPLDARHRALGDARAALSFVDAATRDLGAASVTRAIERQCKGPSLPPQLPADALEGLPHSPGVYLFYGEDDALLYVGKSIDLHDRVRSHLAGDHRTHTATRIAHRLTRIDWQETVGELGALLREARLIKQLRPLHNRRLREAGAQVVIAVAEDADGYLAPAIVPVMAMVLSPLVIVSSEARVASRGAMISNLASTPAACRIGFTYRINSASWARASSSQKIARYPVARCRSMASLTQSSIGALRGLAERQMSPA